MCMRVREAPEPREGRGPGARPIALLDGRSRANCGRGVHTRQQSAFLVKSSLMPPFVALLVTPWIIAVLQGWANLVPLALAFCAM